MEQVAKSVNLSVSRLRTLFKAEMNMSPKQYIKKLRLEKLKEMAETSYLTTGQIIANLEAGDESHCRREFKKAFGKTLAEYRRLCDERGEE
jgi:transcriptional regulator GlxA family with amidase domain